MIATTVWGPRWSSWKRAAARPAAPFRIEDQPRVVARKKAGVGPGAIQEALAPSWIMCREKRLGKRILDAVAPVVARTNFQIDGAKE